MINEGHLARVDQDIKELKESYTFVNNTTDELIKSRKEHSDLIQSLEKKVAKIEAENTKMQNELVDIRARSMRSNLVLYNLPEKEKEDPFETVRELFAVKMKIDVNHEIEIERAHRIEGKKDDDRPRPIVIKFLRYQDIRNTSGNLHTFSMAPRSALQSNFQRRLQTQGNFFILS